MPSCKCCRLILIRDSVSQCYVSDPGMCLGQLLLGLTGHCDAQGSAVRQIAEFQLFKVAES